MACTCGEEECEYAQPEIDTYGEPPGVSALRDVRELERMTEVHVLGSHGGVTIPLSKVCTEHGTTWFSCWRDHFVPWLRQDPSGWATRGETVAECG